MRDYDGDAATALNAFDGCGQGGLPFRVEIRVGFVEHNQEWIAIERPRKADALALAARKGCALRPEFGLVAVRHAHDHLMDARGHGGADDRSRIRSLLEPRNVALNRPVQERYFLRQKTD